jgi:hypothetical protein
MTRHLFTDTATASLQYVGDAHPADVSSSNADTVQLDTPWETFFGTDEFVRFEATIAQPIVQPYFYDGELQYFKKEESELKRAQGQLQHLPWTMGHPPRDRITDATQIRGFWADPEYDDGQHARLYIPADDTEAIRFAVHNDEVSVGFAGSLDYDISETTESGVTVDAVQRDMAYDHVASVENGRCPPEKGCKVHIETDGMPTRVTDGDVPKASLRKHGEARRLTDTEHGESDTSHRITDGVRTTRTEEGMVVYEHDAAHEMEDAEHLYDTEQAARDAADEMGCSGVHGHETPDGTKWMPCESMRAYERTVGMESDALLDCGCQSMMAPSPFGRRCSEGPCSCGLHTVGDAEVNGTTIDLTTPDGAQSAAQAFLDAKQAGLVPDDCGTGVGTESARMIANGELTADRLVSKIAPYLTSHEEDTTTDTHPTNWSMDPETDTPWTDCGDAMYAAWGWHSLTEWAQSTADEIKRAMGEPEVYSDAVGFDFAEGDRVRLQANPRMVGEIDHNPDDPNTVMVTWLTPQHGVWRQSGYTTSQAPDDLVPVEMDPAVMETTRSDARHHVGDAQHGDAPRGVYVSEEGDWYGVAPSETADDEPKYELNDCNDVKDAYNLRNNGDYEIETQTLVDRIKRVEARYDCSAAQTPWTDTANQLAAFIASQ